MEWTGVMELRRPMRTFKVKCPRTLGNPGQLRDCGGWVVPIDIESGALRIRSDSGVGVLQHFSTLCDTFSISGQSRRGNLVRPIIKTEGCVTREVEVQRVRHVYIRHTQLDRTQFRIELKSIDYEGIDAVCLYNAGAEVFVPLICVTHPKRPTTLLH